MKKTRMPQRLLSLVLVLMMLISVLPVSAMAAELTPSDPETGLTATDVTNELTDSDRLAIFEENMDSDKVSRSEIPADDEMVRVIVQLDADSLLDVRNRTNASMSMLDFQQTDAAKAQLKDIANLQLSVMNTMESKGIPSSFTFSYTSVVSGFAAQVPYGKIHDIKNISGVEDVVLCQTYYTDSMGSATLGQALTAAEVAAYSNNTQYQGEGMLIGILDTGLDVNHEAFANAPAVQKLQKSSLSKLLYTLSEGEDGKTNVTAYSYAALWYAQKHSSSSLVLLTEDDLYKSGKVPFAFDYADADADVIPSADAVEKYGNDHGTHVAGITAGKTVDADGSVTFAGQSPEAQLAIFKVFSDSTNGASTDTILAALNDALLLDVDVINMSLGSNGGFGREAEGDLTTKYYDLVKSAGILLNCSAGNSYSSSQGGAKGDFTSVSDPDTGIISSSSSYDAALSVASVNANETAAFVTAQGRVPYQDVSGHDFTALLLGNDSSRTYEYVMVPNTGDTADYQGLDVTGKIAVVMRGGLSFEQKQLNAASAGAAGCIIYNNRDGYLLNMSVDNYKIPTVCISLANGQMMEAAQEKTLTVSKTEKGSVAMSDFSSWGPLPSLSLKPEITAPGGSIYSSLPFAQYGYMSGTSMASPYLAGVAAAALQYVNTLMPGASDTDKQLLVNRLLMSTADILYDENGVAYSPRKQGSGMVNLAEAVTTPAYLYVRGQDKTKIELGDDADQLGVYKLSFVVKNLTGSALSYDVSTTVQTESTTTDGLYIAQKGYVLSADTSAIKVSGGALSGSTVTVPANGEATVTVTVRLSDADRAYLAKFPNGIYVEGFVELTNNDDPALSVPFLGFYGDWTKAPIFEDADIYNGLDEKMYATNVAGVYAMMYVVKLGMYPFVVPEGYDTPSTSADKICVDLGGGNGVSNLYYLQAGLLRAAKTTNVTITDSDTGEVYLNSDGLNVRKAMYNSSSAAVRPGYVGEIFPPLTGIHLIPNNTRMTYTAAAYVDGFDVQDNLKNTYSFNFTSDGEMPYIVDRENLQFRTGEDGRKYLDVTLADNFCLAGATLYSTQWKTNVNNGKKEMSIGSNYYDGIIPALKADGTSPRAYEEYTYTFDVTDFYQKLLQGTFYVVAYDYAMNQCAYRVTLPENAVTRITLDQTAVTLPQKGYVQLNATVTPDDATDQNLVWSSSDSSVAEVKNGIVAAKAPGTATITVKSSVWPDVKAQCQVTVTDEVGADVPMSEFLLNTSSVTMLAGTTYTNVRLYAYAPFYATDLNLEWTSSDESVVTVEPNGEGDQLTQYAKLTVGAKPGVNVQTADYYTMSDFSSWGIPGSLELKPEITAPGGNIYSLQNGGGYQNMSGTSMASPQVAGMAAVVAQYIRANKLTEKTGLTARALAQSLLMSTAVPMYQDYGEGKYGYYSVMQQGAGLANVGAAVSAGTYIKMDKNANAGAADGKVKVELGDDPARTGEYSFGFTIYNLKDAATSFNLSADFFTQNVFANQFEDGSVVNFEDTWTTDLTSNVTWTVDGQMVEMTAPEGLANCDFNGDGKVTKADGQALLDYVTGVLDSISNKDNADFDNDGNIDTYDAYLFFQQLNKSTVEIPANGSIHVEVNAKVLGLDKYDKASDNAGTYVEGYVYADEVASAEGVKGDSHSIPVLGYYGNWTDPSMFDIGSYLEYHEAKTESRVPYMYAYNKNATKYQALTVQYAGDSGMYYFGGNPYVDETYDPNRAAINPDTTVFARATFSLIRNAADARATITGENGTVYYDKASGSPTAGAYYYSNGGSWRNAQGYIGINNAPTKAAEGEKITVKVTEAPEYYVTYDAEGNATTNWDALGDGASRTYTAFIDRTEPVLSNVYFKEDVETGTRSLVLTAQDNRYVAAAFLIDYDKMSILDRTAGSPEGAAEGAATDISLDLSKAEGVDHLYIQVADYADNTATYKINLNKEELSGPVSVTLDKQSIKMYKGGTAALNAEVSPFGVKPDGVTWKSSDETVATVNERGIITGVNKGTATITAASIKDPTATASCVVTVQTVDTTLVGALMDTNGDAQFYTWDMEHDTTWKKLVNFETTKSVSASTFDARTGDVYLQDGSFNINKMDLDTGKTLATYPGFEGEIPMWDMEYSLVYSTEAKPMLASVYATYFMSPKPVDNLDLSAFDLGLYLWLFADASYFTAVTSLGANKIDTDKDGVKDTDTELFLALDDAGNIWTMNVYPSVDKETGKDTWGASFGIIESNLANVGYAANPTDDGDLYDSLYATVEGQELVLYLANFTGDASHVYRILLNEDTGKWEAADIGNFGDGVWPATLVGTMYHANEDAAKAVNAAMSKTTVHTAQAVEMTPAQIQRYNGAETQAAKGSLNTAAPVAALVNLPMGDAAENATASNVTVSADEKTVTVNVLAKDAATNGLFTVDYDAANLTLTNVAFNTQYSSYKDASGKVTLGYVDLNGVTAGSTVATLTFAVKDPTALDKINVTVTETERNDQTVNNAETLTADLHTETETVNAKAATCTEDGYTGDVVCKACGKVITKGEVIPATGHDTEIVGAKEPTCTEDGYTGDEVCKTCGVTVKKGEVIPALGHKIKLVGAKEPTCTEDGYTGDEVCTICGEIVKKGEVIKATGHQYKDGKCTVCGAADPNYKPSVKTGDESNTALWVLVMASAALLAAAVVVLPRKKHSR